MGNCFPFILTQRAVFSLSGSLNGNGSEFILSWDYISKQYAFIPIRAIFIYRGPFCKEKKRAPRSFHSGLVKPGIMFFNKKGNLREYGNATEKLIGIAFHIGINHSK